MLRRDFIGAGLAAVLGTSMQEAMALGITPNFDATQAPELRPLAGLQGQSLQARQLKVEGRIPAGLRGTYFRNGPGLMARGDERYRHWFDGDGFVQALRFEEGGVSHDARFVQTQKFKAEAAAGRFLVPAFGTAIPPRMPMRGSDAMNVANTSVLRQGDRLYALWEGGSAYELDPVTLETIGPRAWTPELAGMPFSAHPKQEPDGTSWNFGTMGGRMVIYQLSAAGRMVRSEVFDIPPTAMVHDFAVSQRYLVLLLAPLTMDMAALREGGISMVDAMRWHADAPTKVLVIDKADLGRRRMLEMPATMVFHFGNAWDADGEIHLDFVQGPPMPQINERLQQIMRGERPVPVPSTPRFMRIALASGRLEIQARDEAVEFPVVDPRHVARRYSQVFYPTAVDLGDRWGFNGLMKLDTETGRRERFAFGPETVVEEHVLVPKPGSRREGEGWLLGMGYDTGKQKSFVSVFDAQALSAGPLARLWLPYWVPYGFHGRFYA